MVDNMLFFENVLMEFCLFELGGLVLFLKKEEKEKGKNYFMNFLGLHDLASACISKPLSILISVEHGIKIFTLLVAATEHWMQYLSQ